MVKGFWCRPIFIAEHIAVTDVIYRGSPSSFDHTSAYGQWGDIMVELVQDHGTGPSVVETSTMLMKVALHHLAFVEDINLATKSLNDLGFELGMTAKAGPTIFNMIDATKTLGHFIELYEPNEALIGFYTRVKEASINWDGEDAIRTR